MKNVVLTSYYNYMPDPQRLTMWPDSIKDVQPLMDSIPKGVEFVLFHNGLTEMKGKKQTKYRKHVQVVPDMELVSSTFRWGTYYEYLKANPCDYVWMVDATDVEMLKDPFGEMVSDVLYVGSEVGMLVENKWMRETQEPHFLVSDYRKVIEANADTILLNCGLVGGHYDIVMEFLKLKSDLHDKHSRNKLRSTDMAGFNYVCFKHLKDRLNYGKHVNTLFKGFEYDNKTAWWRHK
jgi:hypothetical protein